MTTSTHDRIARQAEHLWQERGCPDGRDTEIWLEAERQLHEGRKAETASESVVEYHLSPAATEQEAIKAAMLKDASRAPLMPHHLGPKTKPPEGAKPLWTRPHGS